MSYEEEDTCMSYEEEDTCMSYEVNTSPTCCINLDSEGPPGPCNAISFPGGPWRALANSVMYVCVCVCVCMYMYMYMQYVCVCVCVCVYVYVCTYVCMYVCMYVYIQTCYVLINPHIPS
jgi:hypothetical protein